VRAGTYNFTCEQGSTFSRLIEIEQPDLATDPTGQTFEVFDLNGYTARMQVRRTIDSSTAMVTLTTENGGLIINQTPGSVNHLNIFMNNTVTATLQSNGVYDIELINNGGEVSRILQGVFTVSPEVTR
jgi:hypothetical protein